MITVYGYVPAWGLPDISPYVTKLVNYLTFTGQPFEYRNQDLARLDEDSPFGKLPYIVDEDGTKVGDSSRIIEYLKGRYGNPLDADQDRVEAAVALAFQRLVEEQTYWSGVIQPRWRYPEGFEVYIPYIVGGAEVVAGSALHTALWAFRDRIVAQFNGQGMGRRPDAEVFAFLKADVDALSDFLGDKPYFMGERLRSVDATIYSTVRHVADQPWPDFPGVAYIRGKANLMAYADRIRDEFKV
ncbi:iIsoprene-epoxide--glutathione S-transferase [Pseudonocardia sp.]|uniref:iIsoprene-epoxide--glutathione S-transferase n=1 Tax=Pseudonocardia sp. TaxID=60912 RepID=UPI003D12A196